MKKRTDEERAVPVLDLAAQHRELKGPILEALGALLDRGHFVLGEAVGRFEREAAEYLGVSRTVGVASGTDALDLALRAVGVGPGDEVITPAYSFFSISEVIERLGAVPVFVDIDGGTLNLTADQVAGAVTDKTRAVVPVHLYGLPAPVAEIREALGGRPIAIVEDAAQAIGASAGEKKVGALGDIAAFSFYPTKNLGACGDGGLVATDRDDLAEKIRSLRDHGQDDKYRHARFGWNSRLDAFQAAILSIKLPLLDRWNEARRRVARRYRERLETLPVRLQAAPEGTTHVYHQFALRVSDRNTLRSFLADRKISTAIHYPSGLHEQPVYGGRLGPFPVTERTGREALCLPIYPEMPDAAVERVLDSLEEGLKETGTRTGSSGE